MARSACLRRLHDDSPRGHTNLAPRIGRLLTAGAVVLAAIATPWSQRAAHADTFDQQIGQLQTQANELGQQIGALQEQSSSATHEAAQTAQALAQTQAQTTSAQEHLDDVNAHLAATTSTLQATRVQLASDREQLSQLVVNMYQLRSGGSVAKALVDSKSFVDTMTTVTSVSQVSDRVQTLVDDVQTRERQLAMLQQQQRTEQQQAVQAVTVLQSLGTQQAAQQQLLQEQASSLSGQAATLAQQLEDVEAKIALVRGQHAAAVAASIGALHLLGDALAPFANGPRTDYFPWGQCTWYVASQRDVSWSGDAWQWAATAAAANMPEGMQPRVGAIVVFGRAGEYSQLGHVGYVVAVNTPTSFTIDESNVYGLGVVDRRYVPSLADVETFIY